ncbi:MAG TPA: single-stranded-DNA-specific exonuclease RecJ, partial [Ktedonobacteraceae bacterium]|nr:single-stranded-DNA-specific exonuclease RecJ [Ktedonobacteraceae bacterium]
MEPSPSAPANWAVYDPLTKAQIKEFRQAGIEYLHAQLLYNRGIKTPEAMHRFLAARYDQLLDPLSLIDMERALERIQGALATHEHITVFGDFDADGVTSAALITRALHKLEHPGDALDYYIPHRLLEARGLSREALDQVKARGTSLVITTDCGSSDVEEVAYAKTLGIDIVITDHHHPPEQLPPAYAMINPWRADCTYSERYLCGVGIAFKLAQALFRAHQREQEVNELLDLVAIGTVGDIAYLLGENHTLVRLGLQQLNHTQNAGLRALIQIANLQGGTIRERDISYVLGPRINAAGRMKHASLAFQLLTTGNDEAARNYAQELEQLNQSRQQQTEELMKLVREQAQSQSHEQVVLVYGDKDTWPEGIIGLVAGKLSEEIKRPVFVLSRDAESSRGSARSHGGFNIIEALRVRADLFERHGGYAQAAGFTIANSNIEELRRHLLNWRESSKSSLEAPGEVTETSELTLNGEVIEQEITTSTDKVDLVITNPEALTYDAYNKISLLGPFGAGNPEPVFRMNDLRLTRRWTSGPEGRHLRVRLKANNRQFNGTYFRGGSRLDSFKEGSLVHVIFCLEPVLNHPEWENKQDIWLKVLYMEAIG